MAAAASKQFVRNMFESGDIRVKDITSAESTQTSEEAQEAILEIFEKCIEFLENREHIGGKQHSKPLNSSTPRRTTCGRGSTALLRGPKGARGGGGRSPESSRVRMRTRLAAAPRTHAPPAAHATCTDA